MTRNSFFYLDKIKKVIFLFFLLFKSTSLAQSSSCWAEVKNIIIEKDKARDALYRQITNGSSGINDKQGSLFVEGRNTQQALVMLHGYPSFPRHFSGLAKLLNEKYGYTIYAPLLSGLGGAAKVGNQITIEDWRKDVDDALSLAHRCAHKVTLVGHSMGGGLAIETLFNSVSTPINSAVLICPMIKTQNSLGRILAAIIRTFGIHTVGPISTKLVKQVFRVIDNIQEYWEHSVDNKIPTFLSVTMDDKVLNPNASRKFPLDKMNVVDGITFRKGSGVGHNEIITPKNPYLEELASRINIFLNEY